MEEYWHSFEVQGPQSFIAKDKLKFLTGKRKI